MLDQVEEGLLSPVDVVEHTDERSALGLLLEQLAEGPGDLLGRRALVRLSEQGLERGRSIRIVGQDVQLLQDFDHRPVRDPFAVREAAAANEQGLEVVQELLGEARLADAGRTQHGEQLARAVSLSSGEGVAKGLQLALPPDHRRGVAPLRCSSGRYQPEGGDWIRFSLQREWRDGLSLDRVPHERERAFTDQDLAGRGRLLEARCDVDGVARREPLFTPGHDLARVDPDPRLHAEVRQSVSHFESRTDCAEGVVLVHERHSEHGHDRIADELLYRSTVRLDDGLHPLEVAGEEGAQRLGVSRLAERSPTGHVAEDDGDCLALLSRGRRDDERIGALLAELGLVAVLVAAGRADPHVFRLDACVEERVMRWSRPPSISFSRRSQASRMSSGGKMTDRERGPARNAVARRRASGVRT